jgi:hypothetical protein
VLQARRGVVLRHTVVPGVADVVEEALHGLDRRDALGPVRALPRKDGLGAVDAGVAQPRLGRGHEALRQFRAPLAGKFTHRIRHVVLPRQRQSAVADLVRAGQQEERRQERLRLHLALAHDLRNVEVMDLGRFVLRHVGVGEGDRAVRRAEVEPDDVFWIGGFHMRCGGR